LQITPSPYIKSGLQVNRMIYLTLAALLLPSGAAVYFYGYRALLVMVTCVAAGLLTEIASKKLRGRRFVMDGSAILISLLLALTLPPTIDLWIAAVGAIFGVGVVKEAFGGLGHYIFSPVMGARIFLGISFPAETSRFIEPAGFSGRIVGAESYLSEAFTWTGSKIDLYKDMFFGNTPGGMGETSALLILIAGVILIVLKLIDWRIPLAFIGTVAIINWALGEDPLFQVLAGGLLLAAFFIATDSVASPITRKGRIIFAVGCGVFTVIIRNYAFAPEGVYYAVLLMNAAAPLIDRFVKQKPQGIDKITRGTDA
jgi:Na+-translocating ferredoxin:NAD+ oxidoreductase subunit D